MQLSRRVSHWPALCRHSSSWRMSHPDRGCAGEQEGPVWRHWPSHRTSPLSGLGRACHAPRRAGLTRSFRVWSLRTVGPIVAAWPPVTCADEPPRTRPPCSPGPRLWRTVTAGPSATCARASTCGRWRASSTASGGSAGPGSTLAQPASRRPTHIRRTGDATTRSLVWRIPGPKRMPADQVAGTSSSTKLTRSLTAQPMTAVATAGSTGSGTPSARCTAARAYCSTTKARRGSASPRWASTQRRQAVTPGTTNGPRRTTFSSSWTSR